MASITLRKENNAGATVSWLFSSLKEGLSAGSVEEKPCERQVLRGAEQVCRPEFSTSWYERLWTTGFCSALHGNRQQWIWISSPQPQCEESAACIKLMGGDTKSGLYQHKRTWNTKLNSKTKGLILIHQVSPLLTVPNENMCNKPAGLILQGKKIPIKLHEIFTLN